MSLHLSRRQYADIYGPTTGDRVRLADTELFIQVERDLIAEGAGYGNEIKFGGGKVIRDGMGQSPTATDAESLDLVITNALILDAVQGVIKADIGIKGGRISAIGHAGNPGIQSGITPGMTVGAATEVIAGEGCIVTAGGVDTHIHFICPQQIEHALASGVTTMLGGGTGPAHGTYATTCTPGKWNLHRMLEAADEYPMNLGFFGKGNCSTPEPLREQVLAGAVGLKLHEDWGTTPPPSTAASAWRTSWTCRSPSTRTHSTRAASWKIPSGRSRGGRSTRFTRRARAAGTRRTSSASAGRRTCCRRPRTRRGPSRSTPSTSTWTC